LPRTDRLTALLLAVTLVFAGTASIAARQAIPDECQQAGHHCGQLSLSDICCCGHQTSSTTLPTAPSERVRLTDSAITMQIVPGALVTVPDPDTEAATVLCPDVPPHGLRFIDLPILFASFLL
jgi:hypothetical protein